jgi:hypothetical protein
MIWKEAFIAWSRYYSEICLESLRKITKNLSQDSRLPDLSNTNQKQYRLQNPFGKTSVARRKTRRTFPLLPNSELDFV